MRVGVTAALLFKRSNAIIGLLRFAEFGEFYNLGAFFRHVSPAPDIRIILLQASSDLPI
jgi:hypothetical protein